MESKSETIIKILVIEDNAADANLLIRELAKLTDKYEVKITDKKEALLKLLLDFEPDLVISDYNVPGFAGFETLDLVKAFDKHIPFIYLSGTIGEENAVEAMIRGAKDCITKEHLKRLRPAIDRELEQSRKQKEHLKEHEELKLFKRILTYSHDSVAIYHKKDGFVFCNDAFSNLMLNLNLQTPTTIYHAISNRNSIIETIEKEGLFQEEIQHINLKGQKVYLSQNIFSFFEEVKKSLYYVVIIRDITAKKIYEDILVSAKERAEESDKLKSAFIANISHEIRTPLNAIIGFTGLLASQTDKEKQNEFIRVIQNSSEQLLKVIEDILEISRIESNQIVLKEDNTSLNNLIDEIYDYYSFYMGQQKPLIKVIHSKGESDQNSIVSCDATRVKQVLNRLINNSFKFTEKGEISFGYRRESDDVLFYVIDSGIGISEEASKYIFDRFRKAEDNTNKKYSGTGLGLAISKQIVELMGGKIWVKSVPGEGTEFYFTLPLKKQDAASGSDDSLTINILKGKTILIAEDDVMNYYLIAEYLKGTDCHCLHAKDGREVLTMLQEKKEIAIVLMDLRMPVMNGVETFQKMRELNINTPVIAQTAFTLDNEKEKVLGIGFNDYLSKPINKKTLLSKLCSALK